MKTLQELIQDLKNFNKDLSIRSLRERYNSPSFFEMMSISRMENQHSAFIKWLLQGDDIMVNSKYSPLMGLLDILLERAEQQGKEKENEEEKEKEQAVRNAILSRKIRISNIIAKCERSVGELKVFEDSKDRIDIHIVCDVAGVNKIDQFEFIIENKVGSKEGDAKLINISVTGTNKNANKAKKAYNAAPQTERYVLGTKYNSKKKPDFIKNPAQLYQFYVFLTPIPSTKLSKYDELEEDETCTSRDFIHINYQDIVDYIIEPALSSNNLSDRVRVFLNEYLNNLSMPCEEDDNDNSKKKTKKNTIIMATYNQDIDTIKKLWKDYHELIFCSIILEKALIINGYRTRQQLFNENICYHKITDLKGYVWSRKYKKSVMVNSPHGRTVYVKDVSKPTVKIVRNKEFNDLFVLMDFYQENKNLLLSIMKILSDLNDAEYDVVREVYNTLANPKDYTKYIIKYKDNVLEDNGCIKVMSKREVVVAFVEHLGHQMNDTFKNNRTYEQFFNDKGILRGFTVHQGKKPENSQRYNAYEWDDSKKNYINKGVADNNDGDIYFSNQWGCNNNNNGSFDKFLKMIKKEFHDEFDIQSWEDYNSQNN